jgi:hypothetical protein
VTAENDSICFEQQTGLFQQPSSPKKTKQCTVGFVFLMGLEFEFRASLLQSRHSAASATPLPHEFVWRTSQDYCVALEITCTVFDLW